VSAGLAHLQGWVLAPPSGAVPLRAMLFAHPAITEAAASPHDRSRTGNGEIIIEWRGDPPVCQLVITADEVLRGFAHPEAAGGYFYDSHPFPWEDGVDDRVLSAWYCGRKAFLNLLKAGDLVLIGRAGSPLAPGSIIPLGSIMPNAFEEPETFALGVVSLLDHTKAYDVHVVQNRPAEPVRRAESMNPALYKKWLLTTLREKMAETDRPKKDWFIEQRTKFANVSPNGASTSWAEIMDENPDLAAVYTARGRPPKKPPTGKPRTKNPRLSV